MPSDSKYKDYKEKLYTFTDRTLLTVDKVNDLFNELLTVLPNNGKLYKYKALDKFHIDEISRRIYWV